MNFRKYLKLFFTVAVAAFLAGCVSVATARDSDNLRIGFDVDDTLLFSTPAFNRGFESGEKPFSPEFWIVVNSSDREASIVKKKASDLLAGYKNDGDEIFVITARSPYGGERLKSFLHDELGINRDHVYFETDGKAFRIKSLNIDIFYGDSDSDIKAALEAGAVPYRIQRSTASSYTKNYNPGIYGEKVIEGSQW